MSNFLSKGFAFDIELAQTMGFVARMNRIRLGEIVKRRKCFVQATNESAGESVQRFFNLNDFEIAGMGDLQLGYLSDVLLDVIDDLGAPALDEVA